MPLKFAFGGKIEVICEFEGIEYILEGADEEGLVGLREGKAGDISWKAFDLINKLSFFKRN
jgi:hypothetical protein